MYVSWASARKMIDGVDLWIECDWAARGRPSQYSTYNRICYVYEDALQNGWG